MIATRVDFVPDLIRRFISVPRPTSNNKRMMPISAISLSASTGSIQPNKLGPITIPASNSPMTDGELRRTASSANRRADNKIINRYRKKVCASIDAILNLPGLP